MLERDKGELIFIQYTFFLTNGHHFVLFNFSVFLIWESIARFYLLGAIGLMTLVIFSGALLGCKSLAADTPVDRRNFNWRWSSEEVKTDIEITFEIIKTNACNVREHLLITWDKLPPLSILTHYRCLSGWVSNEMWMFPKECKCNFLLSLESSLAAFSILNLRRIPFDQIKLKTFIISFLETLISFCFFDSFTKLKVL